jgi:DNA-binding GntR family transcriptional regulator
MPPSEGSENMGEGAYRSIIRMILAYQFKPGDVLLETELAERLGLSRTPVAYALGRLVAEGFLEKRKKMGCIIPVPSADDARKVFYARQIIEGQTAAAAARLARPEEMEDLERALDVQDQAQAAHSKEQFSDSNEAFHLGIARMAAMPSGGPTPTSSSSTPSTRTCHAPTPSPARRSTTRRSSRPSPATIPRRRES